MDENTIENTIEPAQPTKSAAASRSGSKALKRDRKKAKLRAPKPTKSMRGKVRP